MNGSDVTSESQTEVAPDGLRIVEELLNTHSVEFGTDDLTTAVALGQWLGERGLVGPRASISVAGLAKVVRLREGLRALLAGDDVTDLDALAHGLPLVLDVTADPPALVAVDAGSVDGALASILATVAAAVADGSWSRMKVCALEECRWAYYDRSRNRSRSWCDMSTCGNRVKARAFRKKARVAGSVASDSALS